MCGEGGKGGRKDELARGYLFGTGRKPTAYRHMNQTKTPCAINPQMGKGICRKVIVGDTKMRDNCENKQTCKQEVIFFV